MCGKWDSLLLPALLHYSPIETTNTPDRCTIGTLTFSELIEHLGVACSCRRPVDDAQI